MNIVPIYDASVSNAPASYVSAIQSVISWFDALMTNDITVAINFGWGEVKGQALDAGAVAESISSGATVSYQQLRDALSASAVSADQKTAVAALPAIDPSSGASFYVSSAQAKAIGLPSGTSGPDGWVGLNAALSYSFDPIHRTLGGHDAIGALEHEISEILGRTSGLDGSNGPLTELDLFRYLNGALYLKPGFAYFSPDGGHTMSLPFNDGTVSGDAGDWGRSQINDAFAAFDGLRGGFSNADLKVMNVLGYQLNPQAVGPVLLSLAPAPSSAAVSVGASLTLAFDRPVALGSGYITLQTPDGWNLAVPVSGASGEISISGSTLTITPRFGLRPGETYSLVADHDSLTDLQGAPFAGLSGASLSFQTMTSAQVVSQWFAGVLRVDATAPDDREAAAGVQIALDQGTTTTEVVKMVVHDAIPTTSVATLAYEFFTGQAPSAGGMDFLISPTGPNPNNLNSTYYQSFNLENRYINFAVNLGKGGAGEPGFQATYGGLSLFDATRQAYATIFGGTPSDTKVHALLDPVLQLNGQSFTRADYFALYGGDGANGLGTKAAMVGWLMAEGEKAHVGTYVLSNDAFLADVALHDAPFGVDIIGHYAQAGFAFNPG